MSVEKKPEEKTKLHIRNKNREPYDLKALATVNPSLKNYIRPNKFGNESIHFSNPLAVKELNKAILRHYYGIQNWDFPNDNLCPPIPGRADYLHYVADLLGEFNSGEIPQGHLITCLDIGIGASCIYPILGASEYNWNFIGSDSQVKSINSAQRIVNSNVQLTGKIDCRLQENPKHIFQGILGQDEKIDCSISNPPFHSSLEEAQKGSRRKIRNLSGRNVASPTRNFSGISNELIYEGGEYQFIKNMIEESKRFSANCFFFSTLVSKSSTLEGIYKLLETAKAVQIKTIPMGTGNKATRIVAWSFLSEQEQKEWRETRWHLMKEA